MSSLYALLRLCVHLIRPDVFTDVIYLPMCVHTMCVRWSNCTSRPFRVSNGVRQGGLLSPLLLSVYMDDLSIHLNAVTTGCIAGGRMTNHLMYADDIVVFSPSAVGLEDLLRVCELFGIEHDIIFNYKKCAVMVFKSHSFRHVCFGHFYL